MRLLLFFVINFLALLLGGLFTGSGVSSSWYKELNQAPWIPPGWVFGAAWTTVMITFSIYMSKVWEISDDKKTLLILFGIQWILNVSWNPIFFYFHQVGFGLVIISLLTLLVGLFLIKYWTSLKIYSLFILPYLIWMFIATSLNAYIFFKN